MDHFEAFQQELTFLRNSVEKFGETYPAVASELKLSAGRSSDPHVEQLLQSFAFLTGKLRSDMDLQRSEISNQMLQALYPSLIQSQPCMTVLQANVEADGANFVNGYSLEKGTQFYANAQMIGQEQSHTCQMQCCYQTPLWPLKINQVKISPKNQYPCLSKRTDVQAVLSIQIDSYGMDPLYEYPMDKLRFYLKNTSNRPQLYRVLMDRLRGIAVQTQDSLMNLESSEIYWLGFEENEHVLPNDQGGQRAYRLLQEYFAFPDKFYFFDVTQLQLGTATQSFEILFLLDLPEAAFQIPSDSFALNCFPVINLYQKTFKPVQLEQTTHEYRLIADETQPRMSEVQSLNQVKSISFHGDSKEVVSWLGGREDKRATTYFVTRLEPVKDPDITGCDTILSLFDATFDRHQPIDQTLMIKGWCNNRRLPEWFRVGDKIQPIGSSAMLDAVVMEQPTRFRGATLDGSKNIQLISQLTLNHFSMGADGLGLLKQILMLYADPHSPTHRRQIDGLIDWQTESKVKRLGKVSWRGHCRGTLLTLKVDEDFFREANPLLFGQVLSHFFALYTTLNHFVQLQLTSHQQEGVWKTWPPLIGEQVIL
ncbi:type VI secretion system baseplate subunit TssF [Algicola sagamiensis]|uniref:type VI secretion system baseplate subunit TssF n=1 Tax=Algicola sagamiensis TaxID=163869 RepID=UPI00146F84BE|nr:type VI secretion system baseplate subunit TssF [Algicola sagamiensis]